MIDIGVITRIVFSDSIAWFYGEKALIRFNLSEEKFEMILIQNQATLSMDLLLPRRIHSLMFSGRDCTGLTAIHYFLS